MWAPLEVFVPQDMFSECGKQLPQAQQDPDIRDQVRKLRKMRYESLASLSFIFLEESTWPWATLRTLTRTTTVPSSPQVLQKLSQKGLPPFTTGS